MKMVRISHDELEDFGMNLEKCQKVLGKMMNCIEGWYDEEEETAGEEMGMRGGYEEDDRMNRAIGYRGSGGYRRGSGMGRGRGSNRNNMYY